MAEEKRKAELIAGLARSRSEISANVSLLREDLNFAAKARRSFRQNPAIWIGATTVAGLVLARLLWPGKKAPAPPRSKEPAIEKVGQAGLVLGALKIAFDIARPVLIPWATRLFVERFGPDKRGDYRAR